MINNVYIQIANYIINIHFTHTHMEPEKIDQQFINDLSTQIVEFPVTLNELNAAIKRVETKRTKQLDQKTKKQILDRNIAAIQKKFIQMMQQVFKSIQPQLKNYRKHNSINYLDPIILKQLDPKIYHKGYQLHKHKSTPMSELLQGREVDDANKLFTEIFDVMNQLLLTMRIYYGYDKQEQISQALYQSIAIFAEEHQDCILAEVDRRTFIQQIEKDDQQNQQGAPYDILLDVLGAIGEDKTNLSSSATTGILNKAQNLIGVIYKYAISPTIDYTYQKIKNINPLATNKNLTLDEQMNLRMSLIETLRPNMSVRDPLEEKMVTFLIKMVPMNLQEIVTLMNDQEKGQLMELITQVLNDFENPNGVFEKIVKQIMKLLELVAVAQENSKADHFTQFKQAKWIITFYKAFQPTYSPQRRRVMFKICHQKQIKSKFANSIGILKMVESQNLQQNELLNQLRNMPVLKKTDKKDKYELKQKKQQDYAKAIDHELHRIHLFELKNKYDKIPLMQFQRLTGCPSKRVITILFSGFMSQDTSKLEEWGGLIDTIYDSQIYSIRWESKSYGSMFDFAVQTAKDIAQANLKIGILGSLGGPYLRAIAIIREIYKKYHNNPFNPAFKSACKTGQYLAELIIANFKGHFINLVGFSLGTELIKNVLVKLAQKNCLFMINKVYFMGGLTDIKQVQQICTKSPTPLNIINLYSNHDTVLKYLLKLCKPSVEPIGLGEIPEVPGHNIRNQDCSVLIKGHLQYRDHMNLLAKLLNMKDD